MKKKTHVILTDKLSKLFPSKRSWDLNTLGRPDGKELKNSFITTVISRFSRLRSVLGIKSHDCEAVNVRCQVGTACGRPLKRSAILRLTG
jgi:hypothetical protein